MTRRAYVYLLTALTLLVVALSTGARVYYLLLFAMLALFLLSLASVLGALYTVKVGLKGVRKTVERGAKVPLKATVRYVAPLPVRAVTLQLSVPDEGGRADAIELSAPAFAARSFDLSLACPHRGVYPIGVSDISVTDVFGLLTFSRHVNRCRFQVEVTPRARRLPPIELAAGNDEDNRLTRMTEDNASPADVRDWRAGDALKKVHWKLSMRKRELMVRTYEESIRPDTLLLIDLYPVGTLKSHAMTIEDAVCESAAAIARAQISEGYPVRMPLFAAQPTEVAGTDERALGAFVSALTQVPFDSPFPFEKVILLEMRRMQRTGGAVFITPRLNARVADLAIQMRRTGMSMIVIWISDNKRDEARALLSRLEETGIRALRVDPWGDGLTAEQLIGQVRYG